MTQPIWSDVGEVKAKVKTIHEQAGLRPLQTWISQFSAVVSRLFRAQGQNGARQLFVVAKVVIDLGRKAQPDSAVCGE
jgi:hypothetical protein